MMVMTYSRLGCRKGESVGRPPWMDAYSIWISRRPKSDKHLMNAWRGGGVLTYILYMGMCRSDGLLFLAKKTPKHGYGFVLENP